MIFVGIDNGLDGGIVAMSRNYKILFNQPMPVIKTKKREYDIQRLHEILQEICGHRNKGVFVALEKSHARPISGRVACFNTGYAYGVVQGLLTAMHVPYEVVDPKTWMKDVLHGFDKKDKKASIIWCKRMFPKIDWTKPGRSEKYHDGMTDAAAICYWKAKKLMGELNWK